MNQSVLSSKKTFSAFKGMDIALNLGNREQEHGLISPCESSVGNKIGIGLICREGKMNLMIFGIGLVVGTMLGVLLLSLCLAARTGDVKMRSPQPVDLHEGRYHYDGASSRENERKSRTIMQPKDVSLIYGQQ